MALQKWAHILAAISVLMAMGAALYFHQPLFYLLAACLMIATAKLQPEHLRRRVAENDQAEQIYLARHPDDGNLNEASRKREKIGVVAIVVGSVFCIVFANFVRPESGMAYLLMAAVGVATLGVGLCLHGQFVRIQVSRRARLWKQLQD